MSILKPRQVSQILNVSVKTLQNWDRDKKLIAFRDKASNRRFYTDEQINSFLGKKDRISNKIVIYARVSSTAQRPDMENQVEFLRNYANAKGYIVDEVITDIGSGLNYTRKKWNKLLEDVMSKKISKIMTQQVILKRKLYNLM